MRHKPQSEQAELARNANTTAWIAIIISLVSLGISTATFIGTYYLNHGGTQ